MEEEQKFNNLEIIEIVGKVAEFCNSVGEEKFYNIYIDCQFNKLEIHMELADDYKDFITIKNGTIELQSFPYEITNYTFDTSEQLIEKLKEILLS